MPWFPMRMNGRDWIGGEKPAAGYYPVNPDARPRPKIDLDCRCQTKSQCWAVCKRYNGAATLPQLELEPTLMEA